MESEIIEMLVKLALIALIFFARFLVLKFIKYSETKFRFKFVLMPRWLMYLGILLILIPTASYLAFMS